MFLLRRKAESSIQIVQHWRTSPESRTLASGYPIIRPSLKIWKLANGTTQIEREPRLIGRFNVRVGGSLDILRGFRRGFLGQGPKCE